MKRLPQEFADLLSPKGVRVLGGSAASCGALVRGPSRVAAVTGLIDPRWAAAIPSMFERALGDVLTRMEEKIPEWTVTGMHENYSEVLPKSVRVRTALMDSRRAKAFARAQDLGLIALMRSDSFHAFAQALSGFALKKTWGRQLLQYREGDYAGPHNDHHPEEAEAAFGYTDLHITFCNEGVRRQSLVVERDGHLNQTYDIATRGGVTCYRLPVWHYTTPLEVRRGLGLKARRWVLLGTFVDASKTPRSQAPAR